VEEHLNSGGNFMLSDHRSDSQQFQKSRYPGRQKTVASGQLAGHGCLLPLIARQVGGRTSFSVAFAFAYGVDQDRKHLRRARRAAALGYLTTVR
jgi:hypothetical protein